jgi:hypothetical protein
MRFGGRNANAEEAQGEANLSALVEGVKQRAVADPRVLAGKEMSGAWTG